jgi:hypothetical protein
MMRSKESSFWIVGAEGRAEKSSPGRSGGLERVELRATQCFNRLKLTQAF